MPFFQYANFDVDAAVRVYLLGRDGDQCSFLVDDRAVVELEILLEAAEREIGLAQTMDSGPPVPAEGEEGGEGGGPAEPLSSYPTNGLWMEILRPGTNAFTSDSNSVAVILHGTIADVEYELLSKQTLTDAVWTVEQSVLGAPDTNWTPAVVPVGNRTNTLFLWARAWIDSDGNGLPDWWQLQYFGYVGVDPYADPDGDGWNNLQEYQKGTNPNVFNTPPPPRNVIARVDSTGTNIIITWESGGGPVSAYGIEHWWGGEITQVSAATFTFTHSPGYDFIGGQDGPPIYQVRAYFPGGLSSVSQCVAVSEPGLTLPADFVRGPAAQLYLVVGSAPAGLSRVLLTWTKADFSIGSLSIYASNLVNGIAPVLLDQLDGYTGGVLTYRLIATNGSFGEPVWAFPYSADEKNGGVGYTFVDARMHLKENLRFLLRSATVNHPFSYDASVHDDGTGTFYPEYYFARGASPTNYEYAGYRTYSPYSDYSFMNELRPVQENFLWRNYVFNPADFTCGWFDTGAGFDVYGQIRTLANPKYQYLGSGTETPLPLALGITNATWLYYRWFGSVYNELDAAAEVGVGLDSNTNLVLGASVRNCYGLPLTSLRVGANDLVLPGSIVPVGSPYFPNFAVPQLQTVDYYFASQTRAVWYGDTARPPVPGTPDFAVTNTSPLLTAGFGQPISVAGWAKMQIVNGYAGKHAYLEQYFDKAYSIGANGLATTNEAGLLSPYGEFFPTNPGPAALVTMPDIDTGQRGTGVVHVIKLQFDVNHDGTMDTSFGGPDNTSQARPFVFWINNDFDQPESLLLPERDVEKRALPDHAYGRIRSQRDLEDFARLWICGLPSLPANQGYTVRLSCSALGGSPAINLYEAESGGGIFYLTDTNVAQSLVTRTKLATISPAASYVFPANFFDGANKYFLFEGTNTGTGQLTLTIRRGTNVVAETSAWIDLRDVRDLYERTYVDVIISTNPPSTWTSTNWVENPIPARTDEDQNVIIYVHGLNNTVGSWLLRADTAFKRLYWAGYRGKFASPRWPCKVLPPKTLDPFCYNPSELYAYKSAYGLKDYLNQLRNRFPNYRLHLIGHSQGAAVTSEALSLGAPFDTCILAQAAMPASCYDVNAPTDADLVARDVPPFHTPEWQPMGYRGAHTNIAGRLVNFFNPEDGILLGPWLWGQKFNKPERMAFTYSYDGTNGWRVIDPDIGLRRMVTDPQESRAMIARSRTWAISAQGPAPGQTQGVIKSAVNLKAQLGFGNSRDEHSAFFTRPIQTIRPYYQQVLTSCQIQPAP